MIGIGEREGRVISPLVKDRSFGFAHGIGRSGDLLEVQPKALGSSLLQRLAHQLLKQALRVMGLHIRSYADAIVMPMATGMTLSMCLQAVRSQMPDRQQRHKVIWIRVDQKSSLKAIVAAGLTTVAVDNNLVGDEVVTHLELLTRTIEGEGPESIVAVLSCTSCFTPRAPDNIIRIGALCATYGIGHVVNNAYGLQSRRAINLINETVLSGGRIDYVVSSTDKNFAVPVGGAIAFGPSREKISHLGQLYPGRASSYQILDLLLTLLTLGRQGLVRMLAEQRANFSKLKLALMSLCEFNGIALLSTDRNDISLGIAIPEELGDIGAKLFYRGISGARLIKLGKTLEMDGHKLVNFGSHHPCYSRQYLTVASAIGQTESEIDDFIASLKKLL